MFKPLNSGDKLVLFALAEDATRTDAEIAERIEMKESTVGLHRRRLIANKQLFFVNFPAFHKLGCEYLAKFYGKTDLAIPESDRNRLCGEFFRGIPQIYDAVTGDGYMGGNAAFVDTADFLNFEDHLDSFFEDDASSKPSLAYSFFPYSISNVWIGYNFAPMFHRTFDLEIPEPKTKHLGRFKTEYPIFSKVEARVMLELIADPSASDAEISRRVNRSRQRVTELRHQFLEQGLLTPIAVPTLHSLEFGVFAYVHLRFKPGTSLSKKISVAGDSWWRYSFNTLERNSEAFSGFVFRDFNECKSLISEYLGPFEELRLLSTRPEIYVVSSESLIDLVDCSFVPLVRSLIMTRGGS